MNFDPHRKVKVVPYDVRWTEAFCDEAGVLKSVLGNSVIKIHHIGSTSIPGAEAKPIIDIMAEVSDINLVDSLNGKFETIGYIPRREFGISGRRFFTKDINGERSHHVHIYQVGHPEIFRHLAFRDYLRLHPEQLAVYCALKNDLARRYPRDIEAYTDGKTQFIHEIDRKAAESQCPLAEAILLLGPTGSGKTPLGELLEKEGLAGRKCFHFDFGSNLRRYASYPTGLLSDAELTAVKNSLRTGALLTDEQFLIAEKLLDEFIEETGAVNSGLIVLNGLPRHAGQATALEHIVRMKAIIVLDCEAATVLERIRTDAGGDRGGRIDDDVEDVKRKLKIFDEKTVPLVKYYRDCNVPIIRVAISAHSSTKDTLDCVVGQFATI